MIHNLLCLILSFLVQWNFFKYTIAYRSGVAFCPINQNNKEDFISVSQYVLLSQELCFLFISYNKMVFKESINHFHRKATL